jgi:hypothetical protein
MTIIEQILEVLIVIEIQHKKTGFESQLLLIDILELYLEYQTIYIELSIFGAEL